MKEQAWYGVDPDKEVLEILQSAAKSKKVMFLQQPLNCPFNYLFYFYGNLCTSHTKGKESVREKLNSTAECRVTFIYGHCCGCSSSCGVRKDHRVLGLCQSRVSWRE
jgi:hypothetical protein